jgi:phenylalanyl-tRNA synthetase alpha chain
MTATRPSVADPRPDLTTRDLTDQAQGCHALQLIVAQLNEALTAAWGCPSRIWRSDPIVSLADNYDRLGYPPDAITRDRRYTRYVGADHVLRSHTSALVPGALRHLAAQAAAGSAPPELLLVCPGMCYRRDAVDWQHTGEPHQLDLWRIRRGPVGEVSLQQMIGRVVETVLPGARWRSVPAEHPYTDGGRQIDVWSDGQWIEIGECGLAAAEVLRSAGLGRPWSGLAMGLGLDRLLMLRKRIPDIRLLRSTDARVAIQMLDLTPYRPVSHMPPVRRDLSVAVGSDVDASAEGVGDRVRQALGADADAAETVEVLRETPYDALPAAARDRLGISPGQRNLLVRLVLRPLDRTLTDAEANELRDRVYAALHDGAAAEWASR